MTATTKIRRPLQMLVPLLWLAAGIASGQTGGDQGSGGRDFHQCPGCISHAQENSLRSMLDAHRKGKPAAASAPEAQADPRSYSFYPHAGILSAGDTYLSNYTDRDFSSGILDPLCTDRTYNGHRGIDTSILLWDMQDIGVPVFAALSGTVIDAHDGEFDRNTAWNNQPANYVIIDHGNGQIAHYYHFKKDSVAVAIDDTVDAGQQIGLIGSSGISTGPHLHFQTEIDGTVTEPFSGPCGPSSSLFVRQPVAHPQMYVREFTITEDDLASWSGPPESTSSTGTFVVNTTPQIYFWMNLVSMSNGSNYQIRFLRPDGSVARDDGVVSFSNIYHWAWFWWRRSVNLDTIGTWTLEFSLNGQVAVAAPFEVVGSAGQIVNRPPNAAPVAFANSPVANEVPVCRIADFNVLDDPDYDLVRYRYRWKVNGNVRRDMVSAARSDALRQNLVKAGDIVICEVTPSDGILNGPTTSVAAQLPGGNVPEITVEQPAGISLTDGTSTTAFGDVPISTTSQRTFTVTNDGVANLTGLAVTIDGADGARFGVESPVSTTVAPGSSTTFTINFTPITNGPHTATLHIASNDFDESPFDIGLSGTGTVAEIAVEQPIGNDLTDGASSVDFGSVPNGDDSQQVFTIRNVGTAPLTGIAATIDGADGQRFGIADGPAATTLAPGAATTLTLTFSPESTGTNHAALHINSNDIDESPFDIALSGTATGPEISVEYPPTNPLGDGQSSIAFGSVLVGSGDNAQRTFTIRNTGTETLSGLSAANTGGSTAMFSLGSISPTNLAPGASTTLTVTFTPTGPGTQTTTLQISSNDFDENPFEITLSGIGTAPEIVVSSPPGSNLNDGSSTIDFGPTVIGAGAYRTLRIQNSGSSILSGLSVTIDGTNPGDFSSSTLASTSLNPGQSLLVNLSFIPQGGGDRSASLHISSNDVNENPFDIALTGSGGASDIAIELPAGTALQSSGAIATFADNFGSMTSLFFNIRNTGDAPLTDIVSAIEGTDADAFRIVALSASSLMPGTESTLWVALDTAVPGDKSATLRIASSDPDESLILITLQGSRLVRTSLRSWAESFGLSDDGLLPESDQDGDLVSLLEEYAFGLDPTRADHRHLVDESGISGQPLIRLMSSGDNAYLQTLFIRRRTDPDLVYTPEFGDAPDEGPPTGLVPATEPQHSENLDADFSRIHVDDSVTAGGHSSRFGRVKLSYPVAPSEP